MNKKIISLHTALIALAAALFIMGPSQAGAQGGEVVKTETFLSRSAVHAGESFKAALRVRINPGWHINAHETPDEFMFPSDFSLEDAAPFKVREIVYTEAVKGKYEYSEVELPVYEGEAVICALVETAKDALPGTYKLKGAFSFQACDARSCVPPKTLNLEISVPVVLASQEAEDVNQDVFSKVIFKKDKPAGTK